MKLRRAILVMILVFVFQLSLLLTCSCAISAEKEKTLKIGVIAWLGWPLGINMSDGVKTLVDLDNKNGGLDIGGEKYKVEIITYDNNNNQASANSAVNRLIFRDNVKFILCDSSSVVDGWLPTTEENKVIVCAATPTPPILSPKNKYSFQPSFMNAQIVELIAWYAKNYPDKKNIAFSIWDDLPGQMYVKSVERIMAAYDLKLNPIFYPTGQQDLSAMGTKVKRLNPDAYIGMDFAVAVKPVWQAGYRGMYLHPGALTVETLAAFIPAGALEGFICAAYPVEFDPPTTDLAKAFRKGYVDRVGKWDGPDILQTSTYACLRTALQRAGSLDPDKISATISSGLKFEGPTGVGKMIDRPDMGNTRTIDSINTYMVKKVTGGKPVVIETMNLDEAAAAFHKVYR